MSPTEEQTEKILTAKSIRNAFKDWHSVQSLGLHPLTSLHLVELQQRVQGYMETPAGRGLALRRVLQDALYALRPDEREPDPDDKRWHPFLSLSEQFLNDRSPEWVMDYLCVSKSTYYRMQDKALESISDFLRQREEGYDQQKVTDQPLLSPISTAGPTPYQPPFLAPPRSSHTFVGRTDLLDEIKQLLLQSGETALVGLNGLPGVGKTTVAIELTHDPEVLSHFYNGVLWVGLGSRPDIVALLGRWAAALGLSEAEVARCSSIEERARLIRTAIGWRRMLLVVDDAWSSEDVLAFKVGGPNCVHLVTTRLVNVALELAGNNLVTVRELSLPEGLNLLEKLAPGVVETQPKTAQALVQAVGGLPLALTLMGKHLQKQTHTGQPRRLDEALAQLQSSEARLRLAHPQSPLERRPGMPEDMPLSLQAIIGLSEVALDATARGALRNLSVFDAKPNSFSEAAALAVTAAPARTLDTLVDYGLLESVSKGRYTMHHTIADYAQLGDYFVEYAETYAHNHQALDGELTNLLKALDVAFERDMHWALIRGINMLHPFLERRGLYYVDEHHLHRALQSAQIIDHTSGLAMLLDNLGEIAVKRGHYPVAETYLEQGLTLAQAVDLHQVEADSLRHLGRISYHQGNYVEATSYYEQALTICRKIGDQQGESAALNGLGVVFEHQGDYVESESYHEQALQICRAIGYRQGEGNTLVNLGNLFIHQGDHDRARTYYKQALRIYREIGDRHGEGLIRGHLGFLFHQMGDDDLAREYNQQALNIAQDIGDRSGQADALTGLGHALVGLGQLAEAASAYRQALVLRRELGEQNLATESLAGLARISLTQQNLTQALAYVEEILSYLEGNRFLTYTSIALPKGAKQRSEQDPDRDSFGPMSRHGLDGTREPFRVYLTCYRVLRVNQDPRADGILKIARSILQERAAKISDAEMQRSFLEKVATHRQILRTEE